MNRIRTEIVKMLLARVAKSRLGAEGGEPIGSTPAVYAALISMETERWGAVIKAAKIQPD